MARIAIITGAASGIGRALASTVTPLMASRPGFGAADGRIGPAALLFWGKGGRPWPR